jgi:rhodanese-related sulfurtransferase
MTLSGTGLITSIPFGERNEFMQRYFSLTLLAAFGLILSTALLAPAADDTAKKVPDISIADLKKAIADGKVTVIDANGTDLFKEGHIPTAVDFEANEKKLEKVLPKAKDALIVAYCGGPQCPAYKAAAKAATALGYTNVKHLSAGITGWKKAGEKIEKGEEKAAS